MGYTIRLNFFSNSYLLIDMIVGRPWGTHTDFFEFQKLIDQLVPLANDNV